MHPAYMKASLRQLEAFYHIGRHEGVTAAARALRLDPSTLREHLRALEQALKATLVVRPGSRLTPAGRKLFAALDRARDIVSTACDEIAGDTGRALRFVTSEIVAQNYLPELLQQVEQRHPGVECSAEGGSETQMHAAVHDHSAHFAIGPDSDAWSEDCGRVALIDLPLVLLASRSSGVRSATELWARHAIEDTLFVSAATETLARHFDAGLRGLGVTWSRRRRLSSIAAVAAQVAAGRGFGLAVGIPAIMPNSRIRMLELPHFPRVTMAAFWRGRATPEMATAVDLMRLVARKVGAEQVGS
jgi:DNA-binding transcriptional LysR family regulator